MFNYCAVFQVLLLVCFVGYSQGVFVNTHENYFNSLSTHEDAGGWQLIKVYHPPKSLMWYKYDTNVSIVPLFKRYRQSCSGTNTTAELRPLHQRTPRSWNAFWCDSGFAYKHHTAKARTYIPMEYSQVTIIILF